MAQTTDTSMIDVKRFALIETLIPSTFNAVLPVLGMWFFGPTTSVSLWGAEGAARAMVMPTLLPALIMPVVVTLIIRKRLGKAGLAISDWPPLWSRIMKFMPKSLWARASASAVLPVIVMLPLVILALSVVELDPMSRFQFITLNMICGFLTGLIVLPPIVIAALAEYRADR